jgi:vancomycin resistance protein VanW
MAPGRQVERTERGPASAPGDIDRRPKIIRGCNVAAITELHSVPTSNPLLFRARVAQLRAARRLSDGLRRPPFAATRDADPLPVVISAHASPLRRRLGTTDLNVEDGKIANLRLAVDAIDGLLLRPGEVFSYWYAVGAPSTQRGFRDGLVLGPDGLESGTGGGLCQLSNLLYWMALQAPVRVTEHHHHGSDLFPDDDRVQPFGSGATVFFNYVDLRFANETDRTFQLRAWLTDIELRGQIRADRRGPHAYRVVERGHRFVREPDGTVTRENELWRLTLDASTGAVRGEELVTRNRAVVRYPVDPARCEVRGEARG